MSNKKWVYLLMKWIRQKNMLMATGKRSALCLAVKGANLAEMTRIGVPVPPALLSPRKRAMRIWPPGTNSRRGCGTRHWLALKAVEEQTGKKFGDPANPLLFSCRSGAKFSMPGMMDTVLNIGLNDETAAGHGGADR